jgi:CHAD domain-containing protein
MDITGHIEKYYFNRVGIINEILLRSPAGLSEPDYHDFRVNIKKLRSLSDLIDFSSPHFKGSVLKPLLRLFRQAGRIREKQLVISTLLGYDLDGALPFFMARLGNELKDETRKFRSMNGPWTREQVAVALGSMGEFLDRTSHSELESYLEMQKTFLHRLLGVRWLAEKEIHQLRKRLKDHYYTRRIFSGNSEAYEKLDRYQELMGKWHDSVIVEARLCEVTSRGALPVMELGRVSGLLQQISLTKSNHYRGLNREKEDIRYTIKFLRDQ